MRMWLSPEGGARNLLREPMLHFAVLGAIIFGVYRIREAPGVEQIRVTESRQDSMQRRFEKTQGRVPNAVELDALIQAWVDEEILVREARTLGLDDADPVVRRRLLQKMNWLIAAAGEQDAAPGDDEVMEQMRGRYEVVIEGP